MHGMKPYQRSGIDHAICPAWPFASVKYGGCFRSCDLVDVIHPVHPLQTYPGVHMQHCPVIEGVNICTSRWEITVLKFVARFEPRQSCRQYLLPIICTHVPFSYCPLGNLSMAWPNQCVYQDSFLWHRR